MPSINTSTYKYDFNIDNFPFESVSDVKNLNLHNDAKKVNVDREIKTEVKSEHVADENILIIMGENGEPSFYKPQEDGTLLHLENNPNDIGEVLNEIPEPSDKEKKKRKRNPMEYKMCSRCPIRYRFVRKLKEHMKEEHGVDLFVCKVRHVISGLSCLINILQSPYNLSFHVLRINFVYLSLNI